MVTTRTKQTPCRRQNHDHLASWTLYIHPHSIGTVKGARNVPTRHECDTGINQAAVRPRLPVWRHNFLFLPGWTHRSAPFGTNTASKCGIPTETLKLFLFPRQGRLPRTCNQSQIAWSCTKSNLRQKRENQSRSRPNYAQSLDFEIFFCHLYGTSPVHLRHATRHSAKAGLPSSTSWIHNSWAPFKP